MKTINPSSGLVIFNEFEIMTPEAQQLMAHLTKEDFLTADENTYIEEYFKAAPVKDQVLSIYTHPGYGLIDYLYSVGTKLQIPTHTIRVSMMDEYDNFLEMVDKMGNDNFILILEDINRAPMNILRNCLNFLNVINKPNVKIIITHTKNPINFGEFDITKYGNVIFENRIAKLVNLV